MHDMYCLKCKKMVQVKDVSYIEKDGRKRMVGKCPYSGTKLSKYVKK